VKVASGGMFVQSGKMAAVATSSEDVNRILALAAEMAGRKNRAAIWFEHQRAPGCAGKTTVDFVREGKADQVLAYLKATPAGAYA